MAKLKVASARPKKQAPRAPHELASLADVQIVQRDAEQMYHHEEDRPKPWEADAVLSAVELIRSADFNGSDDLRRNLDFLLDPDMIAYEVRGLADLSSILGGSELVDKEAACWAVEQALRRVAARVEMLQKSAAKPTFGAERYGWSPSPSRRPPHEGHGDRTTKAPHIGRPAGRRA